jgi:hypothetical protein
VIFIDRDDINNHNDDVHHVHDNDDVHDDDDDVHDDDDDGDDDVHGDIDIKIIIDRNCREIGTSDGKGQINTTHNGIAIRFRACNRSSAEY